jgi:signal transduction histidine kinase
MNQWYVSQSLDTYLHPERDAVQIPGPESAWEVLGRLLEDMEELVVERPVGQSAAMCSLVGFFEADAAGLYIAPRPGRPMELVDQCRFPDSAPDQLGSSLLTQAGGTDHAIIQSRILDARIGVWAKAAQESGWQQILDYLLPYRMARLVLAFKERLPRLTDPQAKVALRALIMTISHKQTVEQVAALNRHNEELDHLFQTGSNNLTEGVMVLDDQGRILLCNSVGGQLLGYALEEIVGLPVEAVLASRVDIGQLVQRVLSGQSVLETCHLVLYQRHGEPLSASLRIAPLHLPGRSAPHGAVAFFGERATEQMEAMERDLLQKNAELKRMISILAHEIRNPLAGVKAVLDYLKPVLSEDDATAEGLKTIQHEIRRMDRLLRDALLVSRPSELQTDLHQITDLLDSLLTGRTQLFEERNITVRYTKQPDLAPVLIDRTQVEQVFDNLILNAVHAMASGGILTIEVATTTATSPDSGGSRPVLAVKIGDSGPGIPSEVLERIFDPFFTTKKDGTGLGLTVARRIVRQHNGALDVESWPGIGTIFVVTLPIQEGLYE